MNTNRARVLALGHTLYLSLTTLALAADTLSSHDADYDYDPPVAGSYALPVIKMAPDGAIIDSDSKSLNLRQLTHGRVTVLSFIYTRCAASKACPYAVSVLSQLHALSADDKELATNMRLVSLSFDPDHDTPQRLAEYSEAIRDQKSGCEWHFATAKSNAALESILNGTVKPWTSDLIQMTRKARCITFCACFSSIATAVSETSTAQRPSIRALS